MQRSARDCSWWHTISDALHLNIANSIDDSFTKKNEKNKKNTATMPPGQLMSVSKRQLGKKKVQF